MAGEAGFVLGLVDRPAPSAQPGVIGIQAMTPTAAVAASSEMAFRS